MARSPSATRAETWSWPLWEKLTVGSGAPGATGSTTSAEAVPATRTSTTPYSDPCTAER